jgi:hypothetical protein
MGWPRRIGPIRAATAFAAGLAAAAGATGCVSVSPAAAAQRPCSSYPAPGSFAAAGSRAPGPIQARYSVFRRAQRRSDRLNLTKLSDELSVAGLIRSSERRLGNAAEGGRVYVVAAQHLLGFRLAPPRCLAPTERTLEQQLAPALRRQYRHPAICVIVVTAAYGDKPTCGAAKGHSEALLTTIGASVGLVPDGIRAVSLRYFASPPRTVRVRGNFFADAEHSSQQVSCGVQWLRSDGTVASTPVGCSYQSSELPELAEYRAFVATQLTRLQSQVQALQSALAAGNPSLAQSAWLAAHLTWLQIGQDDGAYGCFGALGGEIDGLAAGHPLGTADPGFSGFHRIEFDLWTDHDLSAAARDTDTLAQLLTQLTSAPLDSFLPSTANGVAGWLLRPHEVLEDAARDTLTAADDYGSGTGLASLTADISAVETMLGELSPTLGPLAPQMIPRAEDELDALGAAIAGTQLDGGWVSVQSLPTAQRQQIDADLGAALETLAPLPDLLTSTGKGSATT